MEICLNKDNQKLVVTLSGRLDSATVPDLEVRLKEYMSDDTELLFDFLNLEYVSSAGIRVLLASYKRLAGNMKIINANENILEVFRITGMLNIFKIN